MPRRRFTSSYARRGPVREPYAYVLIVCEGGKTEPIYFNELRMAHRLSSANIRIVHPDATDPMSIVAYAENSLGDGFDKVFCVFDRDGHDNYDAAVRKIVQSPEGRRGRLIAITSWPCFELWLLMHYRYSSAGLTSAEALREIKRYIADYQKSYPGIFGRLSPNLPSALLNAARLVKENAETQNVNPATFVHVLVQFLLDLRKP